MAKNVNKNTSNEKSQKLKSKLARQVVLKPINTEPGLKVDRGFNISCIKVVLWPVMFLFFEISRVQNWKTKNINRKLY